MSRNSFDINEEVIHNDTKLKLLELKGKSQFNKYDIETLEDRIEELKKDKWFFILTGISIGAMVAAVIFTVFK